MIDLDAAMRAVTLARDVERQSEGHGQAGERRARRSDLRRITDARVLEAVHAGATTSDLAGALGCGLSRAQERVRVARKAAGEWVAPTHRPVSPDAPAEPEPEEVVWLKPLERTHGAPNVWLEVTRCAAIAPPPLPVWARCRLARGHPSTCGHASA